MSGRLCYICRKRPAKYVCRKCSRDVCERCLEPEGWLCPECRQQKAQERQGLEPQGVLTVAQPFVKLFLLGFLLIFVGMVILIVAAIVHGFPSSVGLIVFIGPIPVILGAGEYSYLTILLAAILTVLGMAFFVLRGKTQKER